jgi:hypothetical protein
MTRQQKLCHCGKPVHYHEDGFTRRMCIDCDATRCDIDFQAKCSDAGDVYLAKDGYYYERV